MIYILFFIAFGQTIEITPQEFQSERDCISAMEEIEKSIERDKRIPNNGYQLGQEYRMLCLPAGKLEMQINKEYR